MTDICTKCGKWEGAHATLPGQKTDHLCMCQHSKDFDFEYVKHLECAVEILRAKVEQYRQEWIDCSIKLENLRNGVDCSTCANKGKPYGLSEEIYCESCKHQHQNWKDLYKPKE